MRHPLHAIVLSSTAAAILLALPFTAAAATVDCSTIKSLDTKESWKANKTDVQQCLNRGWPVPPTWVPSGGKGAGITSGGAGGFSYGAVHPPESPPGARNENASINGSSLFSSCNFPPRITTGSPPSISMPGGSCLDFISNLFKDKNGNATPATTPVGISASETCPADSNNANLYGTKQGATGTVPTPCGGMVPVATADLTLNASPTNLATTTNGAYSIWTYRHNGTGFSQRQVAVTLPTYLCGAKDRWGLPVKTVDLTPPTEQMVTYRPTDRYVALHLQSRATMPGTFIPAYNETDPENYLILPIDASGDLVIPPNCSDPALFYQPNASFQDYFVQSALIQGSSCASMQPTIVNYPQCSNGSQPKCKTGSPHSVWFAVCNPANPTIAWGGAIFPNSTTGKCPADLSDPSCTASGPSIDANCDVVSMPVAASATCPNQVQWAALNRPELFYPPQSNPTFEAIAGRTQKMVTTTGATRYYMQTNTAVSIQSTAPSTTFEEGGNLVQHDNNKLLMNAPATLNPGASSVTLTNGGQLVTSGGTLIASFNPGDTYGVPGGAPYMVHVNRSMTMPPNYMVPTVPTTGSQAPYVQLPATVVAP